MRQGIARLARLWFAWTLPHLTPTTTAERDRLRKAHLLSIGVLAAVALGLPLLISEIAAQYWAAVADMLVFEGVHLTAAILNRHGRIGLGSLVYITGYMITAVGGLLVTPPGAGYTMLWSWAQLLIPSIFAGLFLPFWTPLLFGLLDSLLVVTLITNSPSALALLDRLSGGDRLTFFIYIFVMMGAVSIICTVSSYSMERAVAEADRTQELEAAHAALELAHADLARAYAKVEELAEIDSITGLLNHRAMTARLETEVARVRRTGMPLAVIFADLDHFKRVNDTWGHHVGDAVLAHLARLLRAHVRAVDIVARYGGEEFVLILPDHDHDQSMQAAERLRRLVAETPLIYADVVQLDITISMGIAIFPVDGAEIDEVLIAADSAMYRAKHSGRNRVCSTRDDAAGVAA
jgi:diguanylate cyclase (GGDEF)-like protein